MSDKPSDLLAGLSLIAEALRDGLTDVSISLDHHVEAVRDGLRAVSKSLDRLGNGDAATNMGALENLACEVKAGLDGLGRAVSAAGEAVETAVSTAVRE